MHPKREALSGTLTVKSTLVVIVGVLAALVLISCAIAGTEAWRSYTASVRVAEVNANADQLLKGLENIQLERGQTNTALQAPAPTSAETRKLISEAPLAGRCRPVVGAPANCRHRDAGGQEADCRSRAGL